MGAEKQLRLMRIYQEVFSSPSGQEMLEDMKRAHSFYASTARPVPFGKIDPFAVAIAEGERNVILRIIAILESKEGDYHDK